MSRPGDELELNVDQQSELRCLGRRARELAARAVALLEQLARTGAPVTELADGPVGGVGRRP